MFAVGDRVVRTVAWNYARGMVVGEVYTVTHVIKLREGSRLRYVELDGMLGLYNAENFELVQSMTVVSSLDYMNDTVLDEEDKRIIGEALCLK